MRTMMILAIVLASAAFGSGKWVSHFSPEYLAQASASSAPTTPSRAAEEQKAALTCPNQIEVTEQASLPSAEAFVKWKTPPEKAMHPLDGITIFNSEMGDTTASLAPDDQVHRGKHYKQTWHVKDYRDRNVWLECRYRETKATLAVNIPASIQNCEFTFDLDAKGNVTDPRALECR
jgi:hypothetical protein